MRLITATLVFLSFTTFAYKFFDQLSDGNLVSKVNSAYGASGVHRLKAWIAFLQKQESTSEWSKINTVNQYFNRNIAYKTDKTLWGKNDYWANPIETLGKGMGDCEDYAIAKYFSLLSMGVSDEKIRLMYVRQLTLNEPHMVLIYIAEPGDIPFVLDNFNHKLLPANQRDDLKPIYSFNGQGLWLAKAKGLGKKINNSKGISAWDKMLERIEQGEFNTG